MITKEKTDYIITLSEAKDHLNLDVDFTDKDNFILQLIKAATEFAENFIQKSIAVTTCTLVIKDFTGISFEVDEGHVASITSIQNADSEDLAYDVEYFDSSFTITLDEQINTETNVTIIFQTGFTKTTLPYIIKAAILVKVGDLYDVERSSYIFMTMKNGNAFEQFLHPYVAKRIKYIKN